MKDLFWFKFEPAKFLIGTAEMPPEQVGGYIRLLCYDWEKDGLANNLKSISLLSGLSESEASAILSLKFRLEEDGRWRNTVLHSQILERRQLSEKNAENGKKGAEVRKSNKIDSERLANGKRTVKRNDSILEIELEKEINTHTLSPHEVPKIEKVIEHGNMRGINEAVCTDYFNKRSRDGWKVVNGGQLVLIQNWRADFDYIAPKMKSDTDTKDFKATQRARSPAPSFSKERQAPDLELIAEITNRIFDNDEALKNTTSNEHAYEEF